MPALGAPQADPKGSGQKPLKLKVRRQLAAGQVDEIEKEKLRDLIEDQQPEKERDIEHDERAAAPRDSEGPEVPASDVEPDQPAAPADLGAQQDSEVHAGAGRGDVPAKQVSSGGGGPSASAEVEAMPDIDPSHPNWASIMLAA